MRVKKGNDGSRLRERLDRARRDIEPVRVHRGIPGTYQRSGYPVTIGRRWLVLSDFYDGALNGFTAVRLDDITRVRRDPSAVFARRALALHGAWPPPPPAGPLHPDSIRRLIDSAAAAYPLVTVFTEREHPHECCVGVPVRWGKGSLHLQEIDPDGDWRPTHVAYRRDAITRVDVGGRYDTVLSQVGGPPPATAG